jgi:hypothetical protein
MIDWLQKWYKAQCDGDWEHENGVVIKTIDNPGWSVEINLKGTQLEGVTIPYTLTENNEDDWIGYSIENDLFLGAGDTTKLTSIISVFNQICVKHQ